MNFLNLLGPWHRWWSISAYDLFMFGLGTAVVIFFLLSYYQYLSQKNKGFWMNVESHPIYTHKDILLQQKNSEATDFPTKEKVSFTVKLIAIILIILVMVTPFYELLNVEHFV